MPLIAVAVYGAILIALVVGAYAWGRWKTVLWLGVVPWAALSLGADAAWWSGVWDRSGEYEPLPLSMFRDPHLDPLLLRGCCAWGGGAPRDGKARVRAPATPTVTRQCRLATCSSRGRSQGDLYDRRRSLLSGEARVGAVAGSAWTHQVRLPARHRQRRSHRR